MTELNNVSAEDMATDAEIAAMMKALADGERGYFWGEGETKEVGEPRLVLWQEGNRFRLQGRGGVDFGAFGSILVVFRFMQPIMAEKSGVEG